MTRAYGYMTDQQLVSNLSAILNLSQAHPFTNVTALQELLPKVLSREDNENLCCPTFDQEIWDVVRGIGGMKAPGPDGFTAMFYQTYWHSVKHDVQRMARNFFSTGYLLKQMNHTHTPLIPKIENPEVVTQFRPISLCNVSYKIISKILTSRLKVVMPKLISHHQNAFVPHDIFKIISFWCMN